MSLRRGVRKALSKQPVTRRLLRQVDTERRAAVITRSGLFDVEWYSLQAGRPFPSRHAAVADYVRTGRLAGLSPHPLFEPEWYEPKGWRDRGREPLARYLTKRTDIAVRSPHPVFDVERYVRDHPDATEHPGGPVGHFAANAGADAWLSLSHLLTGGSGEISWAAVQRLLEDTVRRWSEQQRLRSAPRRTPTFDTAAHRRAVADASGWAPPAADGEPLVSVVIPVWNRPAQIRQAIESVQRQTLAEWELLVVDDGSTDDTPAVLEGIIAFDDRVCVLRQERGGVSRARNLGIEHARGRYVAFLDSDNEWEPDFLRTMTAMMERANLSAAHGIVGIDQAGRRTYRVFEGGREHLLVGNHISLIVLVVRTSLLRDIGGFAEDLRRMVDYDLVLRLSERSAIPLVPVLGAVYAEDEGDASRITVREPLSWDYVVRSRHLVDWQSARQAPRRSGRVSVLAPVADDWQATQRFLEGLLDSGVDDLEVVLVEGASRRAVSVIHACLAAAHGSASVHRLPTPYNTAYAWNVALANSSGERVVFADPAFDLRPGWVAELVAALDDDDVLAAQPLLRGADGTIAGAGVTFPVRGGVPAPFLAGHPVEDGVAAGSHEGRYDVPALAGGVLAARAADVLAVRGLDPIFHNGWEDTDLSLRLRAEHSGHGGRGGRCVVVTAAEGLRTGERDEGTSRAGAHNLRTFTERWSSVAAADDSSLWRQAGFEVARYRADGAEAGATPGVLHAVTNRRVARVTEGTAAGLPALRWSVKIAAPVGQQGERWGDWHFAQALAAALRRLGQQAVVDTPESFGRDTAYLDDVNLVIRGRAAVEPVPTSVNLLWVISHPDLVTGTELAGYDAAFSAGTRWAREAAGRAGVRVETLLQCTDPSRFHPGVAQPGTGEPVLFVGNTRGVYREVVHHALAAGVDVAIYGSGWDRFIDPRHVRGMRLGVDEAAAKYRAAGVVLNDHWEDMRVEGFCSNRLFDVVAAGGRVISDRLDGVEELFPGAVRTFRDAAHLAELLRTPPEELFADETARVDLAARVAQEHSFDARARRLLDVAAEHRPG